MLVRMINMIKILILVLMVGIEWSESGTETTWRSVHKAYKLVENIMKPSWIPLNKQNDKKKTSRVIRSQLIYALVIRI